MRHVLAHDVGTGSLKTALVRSDGAVVASARTAYGASTPHPGWFEQNPGDYWSAASANTRRVLETSGIDRDSVAGVVFSCQSMGIIPVDAGGQVLHPNLAWVDGRAEDQARALMRRLGGRRVFRALVGIEVTGKDVVPKLRWLMERRPDVVRDMAHVLDVGAYLRFRATGRRVFEWSGACSYGFDLKRKDWIRLFFRAIGFDPAKLPPLVRSTDRVGTLTEATAREWELPRGVAVYGGCDDTQSAALGSGALEEGAGHLYFGSSAWAGVVTRRVLRHRHGAVCLQSGDPSMNLVVGITESAGTHLEWFLERFYPREWTEARRGGDPGAEAGEAGEDGTDGKRCKDGDGADRAGRGIDALIRREIASVPAGSDHLIFTPWLQGERCPVSTTTTRGTLFNLGLEHGRAHVLRALLEGIAFNLRWTLGRLEQDFGFRPDPLRVIGGGAVNDDWLQGIADITGRAVEAVEQPTLAGAVGVAACALAGGGLLPRIDALRHVVRVRRRFRPDPAREAPLREQFRAYQEIYRGLEKAYRRANEERFRKAR